MIYDTTHTWAAARTLALTPEQVVSPMAGRPYDLRHGAVSLWLNNGVAVTEVADRAGHSAEVLLRSVTILRPEMSGHKPRSGLVFPGQSGGRGIRTHGDVTATMVFKTIAIGH
jgi:hypothetical protein